MNAPHRIDTRLSDAEHALIGSAPVGHNVERELELLTLLGRYAAGMVGLVAYVRAELGEHHTDQDRLVRVICESFDDQFSDEQWSLVQAVALGVGE